jgi:hypothetical protein
MSFRRLYRESRRHARFHVAALLTIVVVAYVGVPAVVRVVNAIGGYTSGHYEPKDAERGVWLERGGEGGLFGDVPWDTALNIALFLLVAVVWLTFYSSRDSRRPPPH